MTRNQSRSERGAALVVGLIMLVLITVMLIAALNLGTANFRSVSNMQFREEAIAAANRAIDEVISSNFTASPAAEEVNVDIDNDGDTDYVVQIEEPQCISAARACGAEPRMQSVPVARTVGPPRPGPPTHPGPIATEQPSMAGTPTGRDPGGQPSNCRLAKPRVSLNVLCRSATSTTGPAAAGRAGASPPGNPPALIPFAPPPACWPSRRKAAPSINPAASNCCARLTSARNASSISLSPSAPTSRVTRCAPRSLSGCSSFAGQRTIAGPEAGTGTVGSCVRG